MVNLISQWLLKVERRAETKQCHVKKNQGIKDVLENRSD